MIKTPSKVVGALCGQHFKYDPVYFASGIGTWLIVCLISLISAADSPINYQQLCLGHATVLISMLISTNESPYNGGYYPRYIALIIQFCATIWLWTLQSDSFLAIYSIILVAQLNFYFSRRRCLVYVAISMAIFYILQSHYWHYPFALKETLLFTAFHIFAWLIGSRTATEQAAREEAVQAQKTLEANSLLLADSSKQGERLRIARELHDAIGHQLTALAIKLEVASLSARDNPQAQAEIQQCRDLTGQLLQEIRAVVSDYRNDNGLDFAEALNLMVADIPRLDVEVINASIAIDRADVASALLRSVQEAVTNSLRHSSTNKLQLIFSVEQSSLQLIIRDRGLLLKPITPGNGLKGMRERIEALGGHFEIKAQIGTGLELIINIPNLGDGKNPS